MCVRLDADPLAGVRSGEGMVLADTLTITTEVRGIQLSSAWLPDRKCEMTRKCLLFQATKILGNSLHSNKEYRVLGLSFPHTELE